MEKEKINGPITTNKFACGCFHECFSRSKRRAANGDPTEVDKLRIHLRRWTLFSDPPHNFDQITSVHLLGKLKLKSTHAAIEIYESQENLVLKTMNIQVTRIQVSNYCAIILKQIHLFTLHLNSIKF